MKTIDFTRQEWGHALHGHTFAAADGSKPEDRRFTALVHTQHRPQEGDHIKYLATGGPRTARVLKVEGLGDPRDMFRLEFQVIDQEVS